MGEIHQVFPHDGIVGSVDVHHDHLASTVHIPEQCNQIGIIAIQLQRHHLALALVGTTIIAITRPQNCAALGVLVTNICRKEGHECYTDGKIGGKF